MKTLKPYTSIFMLTLAVAVFVAGCGTFEVGIETASPLTALPEIISTELTPTSPTPEQTQLAIDDQPDIPDLISNGPRAPFLTSELGFLVVQDGQVTLETSPVDYGILWDFSSLTGKLAYSSEFFHGAENNRASISDLWVYDYRTDTATKWLDDNVTRAAWAPDGEHMTAAVYNPIADRVELVLVSGPNQVELIAECASMLFSWSPNGDRLAFVNALTWLNFGLDETCLGTYLVTFPNGISGAGREVSRVSDFGTQDFGGNDLSDKPFWDLKQNALIYPDRPFWVVPLDGSPAFLPEIPGEDDRMALPRIFGSLWAADLRQWIGNYDVGMSGNGGVWIYQLTDDLTKVEDLKRIGDIPEGDNSFIELIDWWNPGESILVLDGDDPDTSHYLSEYWRGPAVWSLTENQWVNNPSD
jgi:hypothetical protein